MLHRLLLPLMLTALLLSTGIASTPRKSSQDQYEQPGDQAQTETDGHKLHRVQLTSTGIHPVSLLPALSPPDLQVGCAEGTVKVPNLNSPTVTTSQKRSRRQADNGSRRKRDYIQWYGGSNLQAIRPVNYQTAWNYHPTPPYYIPVWNHQIPIFFPTKPIYFNPGFPNRNVPSRPRPSEPPATASNGGGTELTLGSRFGPTDTFDDRPSWGVVETEDQKPSSPAASTTQRTPARRRPSPPLFHNPSLAESSNANQEPGNSLTQGNPIDEIITRTTDSPATTPSPKNVRQLDRCTWAIINCCNPSNEDIKYNCFELQGCEGAFWGSSPCRRDIILAALDAAQKFYAKSS